MRSATRSSFEAEDPTGIAAAVLAWGAAWAALQDPSVGARARAMGGGITAFEDDPVSIWCNPAGLATQQSAAAVETQTFAAYHRNSPATLAVNDPAAVPTYVGAFYQLGTVERPQGIGLCYVTPMILRMVFDTPDVSPATTLKTDQRLSRLRLAYARDFKFRPVGEEGWLPHLSIGLGMDIGFTTLRAEDTVLNEDHRGSKVEFGAGIGVLLGVYDNTRNLKVNVGGAYQTSVGFDLALPVTVGPDEEDAPALNWPNQFQLGALVYLLDGLPLKLSAEIQFIDWKTAADPSDVTNADRFGRATIVSVGGEYRVALAPSIVLFPRLGVRFYDAPWATRDPSRLPAVGVWQLRIDTRGERFTIFCLGFGLSFLGQGGGATTLNVSFEIGADAPAVAVGAVVVF